MGCLCRNFHMLCDRQFQYTLVLLYICVKTHNVHRNKKCSVFHICLFNERYDFCDFDIGCSNVSTNVVMLRTRLYWIIKRKPKIHFLILGGGSCNFQPCFRGGSVTFAPKGGGWAICFFYQPHFQMLRPTPSSPHTFWPVPNLSRQATET